MGWVIFLLIVLLVFFGIYYRDFYNFITDFNRIWRHAQDFFRDTNIRNIQNEQLMQQNMDELRKDLKNLKNFSKEQTRRLEKIEKSISKEKLK
jgi:hypothetical protein